MTHQFGPLCMPFSAGTRLGPYEILDPLGAGGMGEVYRARDARLRRDVALKVLPDVFADHPDRLARFEREAQVLASLNHQNIAAVYGLEDSNGVRALVMELVEGRTLAERIAAGPIPLDDVLTIGMQMADALEAAHERGIVHRDLKPANIKLAENGTVKILDFGLAKALAPSEGSADAMDSPTLTAKATELGLLLGTAAYMAPEQVRGKPVDRRADIWAFGVVVSRCGACSTAACRRTPDERPEVRLERHPGAMAPGWEGAVLHRCLNAEGNVKRAGEGGMGTSATPTGAETPAFRRCARRARPSPANRALRYSR